MANFRNLAFALCTLAIGISAVAGADTDTDLNGSGPATPPNPSMSRGGRHGAGKGINPSRSGKNPRAIKGSCALLESELNPLPGPCVNLLLILNDPTGQEVVKARTSAQGQFEFAVEPGKEYRIASGSRFYEIAPPNGAVHGGDSVLLKLRQK